MLSFPIFIMFRRRSDLSKQEKNYVHHLNAVDHVLDDDDDDDDDDDVDDDDYCHSNLLLDCSF